MNKNKTRYIRENLAVVAKALHVFTLATLMVFSFSAEVFANSFAETYGFSANGLSMGNAVTATVDDWSSVYYNIAGLGKTPQLMEKRPIPGGTIDHPTPYPTQAALGFMMSNPQFNLGGMERLDKDGAVLKTPAGNDLALHAVVLGLALDLNKVVRIPKPISSARFGLGAGMTGGGYATKINDVDLRTHNFLRYGREAERMLILSGLGFGFLEDIFGFGIGISAAFGGKANAIVTGAEIGPDEQTPAMQTKMDLKIVPALVAGAYASLKKINRGKIRIDAGISYRQESYLEIYPFLMREITQAGAIDLTVRTSVYEYYIPHVVTGGVAVSFAGVTISGQVDYEMWSGFDVSRTIRDYYEEVRESASDPTIYELPSFDNIITPRLGLSYKPLTWLDLMVGYYHQSSFVPDKATTGIFNLLDNSRNVVSFGVGLQIPPLGVLRGPAAFKLGCQFQFLDKRTVTKTEATRSTYNPDYTFGGWNPTVMAELGINLP
jgi:hypothetical protein